MTRRTVHQSAASEPTGPAPTGALRSARRLSTLKGRRAVGQFLAEGPQAVREAAAAGLVQRLFATAHAADRHDDIVRTAEESGAALHLVSDADLASLTDTVTPQGLVAVCTAAEVSLSDVVAGSPRLVVVCAQVRDPGNAGTVIRCADAFGADAVVLTEGSVDVHNPKTVRATAGSLFHLPIVTDVSLVEATDALRAAGLTVIAADGSGTQTLLDLTTELSGPVAWVLGNEAWGLPEADLRTADIVAKVPMWGAAESLNLSTAAAVCLYATAAAQRASTTTIQMPTAAQSS
jgi:TrmH family RNA methyltransferase